MHLNPLNAIDFYKVGHKFQYPPGTEYVYANFTPRSTKLSNLPNGADHVVFFGLQVFIIDYLDNLWRKGFFEKSYSEIEKSYKSRVETALGRPIDCSHLKALHTLGYLPLKIKALSEGSLIRIGTPCLTIINTHPDFYWLVNYIESIMSSYLWKGCVNATTALWYKKLMLKYAKLTGSDSNFCDFQCHDFSFRGMSGWQDAVISGMAHLTSFSGTDTVAALDAIDEFYTDKNEFLGASVVATEHSVMCAYGRANEYETYKRLITEIYPSGIVSIVSDTWNLWKVICEYLVSLKNVIEQRDGKVVIRPDSGDPIDIICGNENSPKGSPANKGALQLLWEIFGGTLTVTNYKVLNPKIGLIYGDSITPQRATLILQKIEEKGFASQNIIFGVGSFTYQYVTRDTYGFALKSTLAIINGKEIIIYKDPVTDDGMKKSAAGWLRVEKGVLFDRQLTDAGGDLKVVYENGKYKKIAFGEIRKRLQLHAKLKERVSI